MAFSRYAKIISTFNGSTMSEETSVNIRWLSGINPVDTVAKGLAGASQGSKKIEMDLVVQVPTTGFENDPVPYAETATTVEIGLFIPGSGKTLTSEMFIDSAELSHSVNGSAQLSMKLFGEWSKFE